MNTRVVVATAIVLALASGGPAGEAHRPAPATPAPPAPLTAARDAAVTYHRDVAPILQRRCQECHRPGEVAPMSLLTHADARESASRIQEALVLGTMPPWFADAGVNRFSNDRRLSDAEIRTLMSWVDAGAPEGNPADAPPPRRFEEGWTIGKPQLILEMPKPFDIPARGTLEYTIDQQTPRRQDLHLILDNYGTHKHPRTR